MTGPQERRAYLIRFLRGCAIAADRDEIGVKTMDEVRPLLINGELLREAADAFEALNEKSHG